jgi:hypothetical protein
LLRGLLISGEEQTDVRRKDDLNQFTSVGVSRPFFSTCSGAGIDDGQRLAFSMLVPLKSAESVIFDVSEE